MAHRGWQRNLSRIASAGLAWSLIAMAATAAEVQPLHEDYLDALFAQPAFGAQTIDIRFNPEQTIVSDDWLIIDTAKGFGDTTAGSIWGLTQAAGLWDSLTVPLFYVDGYVDQGAPDTATLGLSWVNHNGVTVRADFQADLMLGGAIGLSEQAAHAARAANLVAHELLHNLGLSHVGYSGTNLMNPVLGLEPSGLLSFEQVATVLASPYVQIDASGQRFISITPFAVLSAVPEPGTWVMMSAGMLALLGVRRRA